MSVAFCPTVEPAITPLELMPKAAAAPPDIGGRKLRERSARQRVQVRLTVNEKVQATAARLDGSTDHLICVVKSQRQQAFNLP